MSTPLSFSRFAACAAAVLLAVCSLPAAAQGKDEQWDITMKMEMAGMPMAMPARTQRVCVEKSAKDESYVPKQDDCKTVEAKRTGNKFNYKMVCEGKFQGTSTGEMTFAEGAYDGRMHMVGKMDGQPVDMTQTFSGKRVGDCTSTAKADAKAATDRANQGLAESCKVGMDNLSWQMFMEPKAACAAQKAEFCGAVSTKARAMAEPSEYQASIRKYADLPNTMSKCGENLPAVTRTACARGVQTKNWTFVGAGYCDDDVRTIGDANCRGRSFTAVPGGMGPVCSRYAALVRTNPTAADVVDANVKQPTTTDAVQEGVNQLRKLLPF
jgi:hypothetical protein